MSETPQPRTGRFATVLVTLVVAGSAVGVLGWHLLANRSNGRMDAAGFDLDDAPKTAATPGGEASSVTAEPAAPSSLGSFKAEEGMRIAEDSAASKGALSAAARAQQEKEKKREDFAKTSRKYEAGTRDFAVRMTQKYPVVRQYGKDWMSYPDLKKLNDDFMRDRDPVKFMLGLAQSQNFGKMMKKYAGSPEIREFALGALKQSPLELKGAVAEVISDNRVIKDLVTNIARGMGLPPAATTGFTGGDGAPPSQADQGKAVSDMMNDPEMKKMLPQGQQAAPVNLGR